MKVFCLSIDIPIDETQRYSTVAIELAELERMIRTQLEQLGYFERVGSMLPKISSRIQLF